MDSVLRYCNILYKAGFSPCMPTRKFQTEIQHKPLC
uniref:Uncharacterized protein n=1 Tax=Anguilla anguilla TaxID=7936 RepID=A0A0E9QTL3_ANGAN